MDRSQRLPQVLFALVFLVGATLPVNAFAKSKAQNVFLDGQREKVTWNDGDSFRITKGPRKGVRARLSGYNTLESYGPVHFWGDFHAYQLLDVAQAGTAFAKTDTWDCVSKGEVDGYGRILVSCPDLTKGLIAEGLAHIFEVENTPDPELVKIQADAQNARKGMWRWGIPARIVTSIHSQAEYADKPGEQAYNRVCDTRTGKAWVERHTADFKPCDAWCHGGSCMIYVPFEMRYGAKRPQCVREGRKNRLGLPSHLKSPL